MLRRILFSLVVVLSFIPPRDARAQAVSTEADAAFQKSDWNGAADGYARALAADSTKGVWWFRLGVSYQSLGKFEPAIRAFEHAGRLGFQPVADRYRIARLYSRLGKADLSLNALDSAITLAGGGVPSRQLTGEPDFDNVRNDPRFVKAVARVEAARYPCRSMPEAHQLDFWVGVWEVTPWNAVVTASQPAGTNDIHPILENCVVFENWTGGAGGEGKSFNFFDTNLGKWRQIWMADGGGPLDYTGEFKDGAMRFVGWNLGPDGKRLEQRLTLTPIAKDTVRQTFENSKDGGKTWTTGFDARYTRKK